MNDFFSGKRFQLLILQHWADNRKRYLLSIAAYIGVMMLWFLVAIIGNSQEDFDQNFQKASYYLPLFALGSFYASQYFSQFSSTAKGINFLMVPASHFEKLLCGLFYSVLLFLVLFTACFYLVDIPASQFMKDHSRSAEDYRTYGTANVFDVEIFDFADSARVSLLLFYLSVQSVFLFGSVLFRRYSFLKTGISGMVFGFLVFIIAYLSNKAAFDNDTVFLFTPWVRQLLSILTWLTPVFFWTLTYFRLKAKQV
ncbi:MAG: hypothetical protein EOO09_03145 [Chitinophagaceae bacterium]|nr:MAG: hypothetical protein EOO09_03145 [Chitinophagaceae bacterium]